MERILVGVDGSIASQAAMRWACAVSERTGAGIVALHAYQRPFVELSPEKHAVLIAERKVLLEDDWVRGVRQAGRPVEAVLEEGDPRDVVARVAGTKDADLVVLGRSGRGGGPGFLHLGSVVEHTAHHVQRPLVVIPPTDIGPIRRIVIGVDGSAESAAAVEWCAELASAVGASVIAAEVEEPIFEWTPSWDDENWRRRAEHDVANWLAPVTRSGVASEAVATRHLHPADGLLGVASARRADLLVIGTRGAGGFAGLRFGGVAMKVLHRASLPLALVPPEQKG